MLLSVGCPWFVDSCVMCRPHCLRACVCVQGSVSAAASHSFPGDDASSRLVALGVSIVRLEDRCVLSGIASLLSPHTDVDTLVGIADEFLSSRPTTLISGVDPAALLSYFEGRRFLTVRRVRFHGAQSASVLDTVFSQQDGRAFLCLSDVGGSFINHVLVVIDGVAIDPVAQNPLPPCFAPVARHRFGVRRVLKVWQVSAHPRLLSSKRG